MAQSLQKSRAHCPTRKGARKLQGPERPELGISRHRPRTACAARSSQNYAAAPSPKYLHRLQELHKMPEQAAALPVQTSSTSVGHVRGLEREIPRQRYHIWVGFSARSIPRRSCHIWVKLSALSKPRRSVHICVSLFRREQTHTKLSYLSPRSPDGTDTNKVIIFGSSSPHDTYPNKVGIFS